MDADNMPRQLHEHQLQLSNVSTAVVVVSRVVSSGNKENAINRDIIFHLFFCLL